MFPRRLRRLFRRYFPRIPQEELRKLRWDRNFGGVSAFFSVCAVVAIIVFHTRHSGELSELFKKDIVEERRNFDGREIYTEHYKIEGFKVTKTIKSASGANMMYDDRKEKAEQDAISLDEADF